MKPKPDFVRTRAALAAKLGCHVGSIPRWSRQFAPDLPARGPGGEWDASAWRRLLESNGVDLERASAEVGEAAALKLELLRERVALARREREVLESKSVTVEEVNKWVFDKAESFRAIAVRFMDELPPRLAGLDAPSCTEIIKAAMAELLLEFRKPMPKTATAVSEGAS